MACEATDECINGKCMTRHEEAKEAEEGPKVRGLQIFVQRMIL